MMLRLPIALLFILLPAVAFCQSEGEPEADTTGPWAFKNRFTFQMNQVSLSNWQAGGNNSLSFGLNGKSELAYEGDNSTWTTTFAAAYGLLKQEGTPLRKTDDNFEFNTEYGYKLGGNWSLTAYANLQSQFTDGFNYTADPEGTMPVSAFMAPGFLIEGLGVSYKLDSVKLNITLTPVTGRQVFVLDDRVDETVYGLDSGKSVRYEFGFSVQAMFDRQLWENTRFVSNLLIFSDYLNEPQNLYTNWKNELFVKLGKVVSVSAILHLIYDPRISFPVFEDQGGTMVQVGSRPQLQLRQVLGFGVTFDF